MINNPFFPLFLSYKHVLWQENNCANEEEQKLEK
jgi:hypothetical protein